MPESSAPTAAAKNSRNLLMRVAAAALMVPLALMFVFAGGWLWVLLVTAIAVGLFYEWHEIVNPVRNPRTFAAGVIALELIGLALWFGWGGVAWAALILGTTLIAFLATEQKRWITGGFIYAAAALIASAMVRLDGAMGFYALMFTLLVVWASDIGGYFAGRAIGGPKLWPRVSPNKTWAGSIGALILSALVAVAVAWLGWGRLVPLIVLALAMSVVAQLGDLFESAVKRRFGVKDSSQIIPGHGGLMDRLDGFVAAIVFVALIGFLRAGADGIGRGFMIW
ncbi:MAG: phosphatidate cytidylyltransferase [Afipia felis]|nr:phosphatidate cytidylyltransferase [Afipia felis]